MKTGVGQKGNKEIKVARISYKQIPEAIKQNLIFNTGKIAGVGNPDGTQGIMSKIENGKVYFWTDNKGWWEE